MSLKSTVTPRAPSQRETVGKKASKVWTIRALEKERARALAAPTPKRKTQPVLTVEPSGGDRTLWRRLPLLSRDPMPGKG